MNDKALAVEFKGRHDHISARMQQHALKKLERLQRYNGRVARIEVVADHAHEDPEVELIVHMQRGKPLVARERSDSFSKAIDLLVDKMETQLKKQKEKQKAHKVPDAKAARAKATGRRAAAPKEETYEEVVRRTLRG